MSFPEATISTFDYIIFALSLLSAVGVGIYFAIKDRKASDEDTYYFGDKSMAPFPVGMSIALTYISAITAISYPTEGYVFGTVALWMGFSQAIANLYSCIYFIPLWHRLQLPSMYMYLELRFNVMIRRICFVLDLASMIFYMGIVVYLPALAVNAICPIDLNLSIVLTAGVCTLYTTVGGMKAVVWTDALQAIIMMGGIVAGLVGGVVYSGGFHEIYAALDRGDRLNLWTFDLDPRIRSTFWTIIVGASVNMMSISCMTQSMVQRFLSVKDVATARKASFYAVIPQVFISSAALLCGVVAYAVFEGCDPIRAGVLHKYDQIMPYLVLVSSNSVPGLSGLFLAAAYSGTLSTVSSGLNSLSMLFVEELVKKCKPDVTTKQTMFFSKVITLAIGAVVMCLALVIRFMGSSIISVVFVVAGAMKGPMFGMFILGTFFPWTNKLGAGLGTTLGFCFVTSISLGRMFEGVDPQFLRVRPMYIDQCPVPTTTGSLLTTGAVDAVAMLENESFVDPWSSNITTTTWSPVVEDWTTALTTTAAPAPPKEYTDLFQVSVYYSGPIGLVTTVIFGLIISFLTGASKPEKADPRYFMPMFPGKFWRFGVPPLADDDYSDELKFATDNKHEKIYKNGNGKALLGNFGDDDNRNSTII